MGPVQGPDGASGAAPVQSFPVQSAPVQSVPAGRLHGVIDVLRANRVAGWAIDRADEAAAVQVDILRDGRVIATVTADRHRPDLQKGGIGTGRYGFMVMLDPPVDPGFEFTVAALARTADGHALTLRPVPGCVPEVPADLRLLQRLIEAVGDLRAGQDRPAPSVVGLATTLDRIELVQARIEARLDAVERPPPAPRTGRYLALSAAAVVVGAASLALGALSLFP